MADGKLAANGKPTKVAPRNLRAVLSKMFDWAADQGLLAGNPAAGVKLPARVRKHLKKGGRDRVLSDDEIGILWGQLDRLEEIAESQTHAPVSAAAFRLILLTAQRPGEVLSMRWVDIEDGEANRVPLSPQAKRIVEASSFCRGSPGPIWTGPCGVGAPLTTIKTANNGILKRSGMRPWTPHDLRRTAASKMRAMGTSRRVVQAILNHKDRSVTAVYDRYGLDKEKVEALTAWGQRIQEIVSPGFDSTVLRFSKRSPSGLGERRARPRVLGDAP